jgi:hypothetical protein
MALRMLEDMLAPLTDGTGGLRVTGSMCKPVRVFNKDTIPVPLTFDALCAAQAYVGRNQPGAVRIVRVTEDSEREVVGGD